MAYIVKARFYTGLDQTGEGYIIVSDNFEKDTKLEVGSKVYIEQNDQRPKLPTCKKKFTTIKWQRDPNCDTGWEASEAWNKRIE